MAAERSHSASGAGDDAPGLPGRRIASAPASAIRRSVPRGRQSFTCRGCDAQWGGLRVEHCTAPGCHLTFSGTTAGDKHRVGKHGVTEGADRRRCLTVQEMRALRGKDGAPWFAEKPNNFDTIVWGRNEFSDWWEKRGGVAEDQHAEPTQPVTRTRDESPWSWPATYGLDES